MNHCLQGKTAIITGATGQLGRVMARTLAQHGADIAVHYLRNKEMADQLVAEIEAMGQRALAVQAEVASENAVNTLRDTVFSAMGPVHIVVNNAVQQYPWKSILAQPVADFQSQFNTCTLQSVLTAKAFLPAMLERNSGRFIGINSECAALCHAGSGAYAAAKRGMDGLYRVLAKEVGAQGVTVNQVAPGWTVSDRDRAKGTEVSPSYAQHVPLGRRGTDQEIADAVLFLASDAAAFITGVNLPVCGGTVMC